MGKYKYRYLQLDSVDDIIDLSNEDMAFKANLDPKEVEIIRKDALEAITEKFGKELLDNYKKDNIDDDSSMNDITFEIIQNDVEIEMKSMLLSRLKNIITSESMNFTSIDINKIMKYLNQCDYKQLKEYCDFISNLYEYELINFISVLIECCDE